MPGSIQHLKHFLVTSVLLGLASGAPANGVPSRGAVKPTIATEIHPVLIGNATNGARLYQACMGCHSLNENDVGPRHRGVVGRKAGSLPDYAYSAALRRSGIVWTPANLDTWLANPQKLVPGSKMYFSIPKPQDRADIVAYLAQQR